MTFEKRLYIMTGDGAAKGAVTVERNAFGCHAEVNIGMAEYFKKSYFVFVSDRTLVFEMGGRNRFDLGTVSLTPAHVAVVSVSRGELKVELYGSSGGKRLWQSNLLDMVRGRINDFEKTSAMEKSAAQNTVEKTDSEKRLSIFPVADNYDDGAIAKVNYYSNIYSAREKTPSETERERARLEELAGNLIQAKLDVDMRGQAREVENVDTEILSENEPQPQEEAAAVAVREQPDYARYIYAYRDEILRRNAAVADYRSVKTGTEKISVLSENPIESDVPSAPKADLKKSEKTFADSAPVKLDFYERIKSQLDRLFDGAPHDETLEKLLPSSRFVRIGMENSDKYYCVGLIGRPDYICYAVPAEYTPEPPEELDGYCQWLPLDAVNPKGSGYWLIYQDAVNGESVNQLHESE